jgi:aspartate kinase
MRKVHVLKFGGTSVGNGERIRHVARIIASVAHSSEAAFPVAVVSAMAGVTDALLAIAQLSCTGKGESVTHKLDELKQRYIEAATQAITGHERLKALLVDLEQSFRLLEAEVALLPRCYQARPYSADASPVAAWGERLSARLLAVAVQDVGVQATAIREEVIVLRDQQHPEPASFGVVIGADPLLEATRVQTAALLHPLLERRVVPIVPGFIGRTPSGVVKTLGRGGSDLSATVIGAVLDECIGVTIFTDVDGVFSADPRLVGEEHVRLFPHLSYAEASHLARSGAQVLHPQTLAPVMARRLPVQVRNTFRLHLQGTMIGPEEEQASEPAIPQMMQ